MVREIKGLGFSSGLFPYLISWCWVSTRLLCSSLSSYFRGGGGDRPMSPNRVPYSSKDIWRRKLWNRMQFQASRLSDPFSQYGMYRILWSFWGGICQWCAWQERMPGHPDKPAWGPRKPKFGHLDENGSQVRDETLVKWVWHYGRWGVILEVR